MKTKSILAILACVLMVIISGYAILHEKERDSEIAWSKIEGWETYRNPTYDFELQYPPQWKEEDGSLIFNTQNGYRAVLAVYEFQEEGAWTTDKIKSEYEKMASSEGFPGRKTEDQFRDIEVGSELGIEEAGIACEPGYLCFASYVISSNETLKREFQIYLIVRDLKDEEMAKLNYSYDPRPLFEDDFVIVEEVLKTLEFGS